LVFPAEFEAGFARGVVAVSRAGMPLGEVGGGAQFAFARRANHGPDVLGGKLVLLHFQSEVTDMAFLPR
jgi:hypothetical protein